MAEKIITLTTDFGEQSHYVGVMKGVILSLNPQATLVDITHGVPPQDVRHGAWVLGESAPFFPPETIHAAVVDPGVGSARRIVYARIGGQHCLAPDNGLLSLLAQRSPPERILALENPAFWLPKVSATFHGRDVIAPVAARLSLGFDPLQLGPPVERLADFDAPRPAVTVSPGRIEGRVAAVDSFGNLVSDIREELLAGVPRDERTRVACGGRRVQGIARTYSDGVPGALVALVGSGGFLELAVVNGSAAGTLGIGAGERVTVSFPPLPPEEGPGAGDEG